MTIAGFTKLIVVIKLVMLTMLLCMSFVIGHTRYVSENPKKFLMDSTLTGLSSAAGLAAVAALRGRVDAIPSIAVTVFFVFFSFNVLREFSGMNALHNLETHEKRTLSHLIIPIGIVGTAIISLVLWMSMSTMIFHPLGTGMLLLEAFALGVLFAASDGVVAKNHKEKGPKIFVIAAVTFGFFFVSHIVLQFGGFYSHFFDLVKSHPDT